MVVSSMVAGIVSCLVKRFYCSKNDSVVSGMAKELMKLLVLGGIVQ